MRDTILMDTPDDTPLYHALNAERPRLVRLCAYLTDDPDVAEDLAQETLIEAWRHQAQLRDPDALRGWLSGIARNVTARWRRATGREQARSRSALELNLTDQFNLEIELERDELTMLLDHALALLPAETRTVLVESYISESPHAVIAAQLGLSENAVAVRLHRGKLALRRLLSTELRDEAAAYGLVTVEDEWQETRIWCSNCGQHRLLGKFTATEFGLRCPHCCIGPDAFHSQSRRLPYLDGVTTFRPALNRFGDWINILFQTAIREGAVACSRCGQPAQLRLGLPAYAPTSWQGRRAVHVKCAVCGAGSYSTLDGLILSLPEGRQFWRTHGRIRWLPEREIEFGGQPAIIAGFESVTGSGLFEVIVADDRYQVLAIHRGGDA